MTGERFYRELNKLSHNIQDHLPDIEAFLEAIPNHLLNDDRAEIVYDFQALMNRLQSIKDKADGITAELDHG